MQIMFGQSNIIPSLIDAGTQVGTKYLDREIAKIELQTQQAYADAMKIYGSVGQSQNKAQQQAAQKSKKDTQQALLIGGGAALALGVSLFAMQ